MEPTIAGGQVCRWHARVPLRQVSQMFRVTFPTQMDDRQLSRWIKRVLLLLVVGTIAFAAFYAFDRWRPATTPIVDQRLAALEQAVRDTPDDVASRGQLADTYVAKGRFADALVQYDAIIATGKADEPAKYGRASAYMGLGQLDNAAKDYQAVVDIAKNVDTASTDRILEGSYYGLGYVATGQMDKAETALRSAVEFVPIGWSEPYTALAQGFTKAGKAAMAEWAGAMADLADGKPDLAEPRLLAIVNTDAGLDAAIGLGLLYETKGDTASA